MLRGNGIRLAVLICVILSLAACSGAAEVSGPDRVETRVAEELAVARKLTAVAQSSIMPTQIAQAPTVAVAASATPVPPTAAVAASATPVPPTETPLLPTPTNTSVPPTRRPPTATLVPPTQASAASAPLDDDPTAPGFGTPKGLIGKIVLPGYSGPLDVPVFRDRIVFKLLVFDPAFGNFDGAGIKSVNIEAFDPLGRTVIERREGNWAYCAFGNPQNSPDCTAWLFSQNGFAWPNGTPVCAGSGYSVNMIVETENPANNEANWGFVFAVEAPDGSIPNCF